MQRIIRPTRNETPAKGSRRCDVCHDYMWDVLAAIANGAPKGRAPKHTCSIPPCPTIKDCKYNRGTVNSTVNV